MWEQNRSKDEERSDSCHLIVQRLVSACFQWGRHRYADLWGTLSPATPTECSSVWYGLYYFHICVLKSTSWELWFSHPPRYNNWEVQELDWRESSLVLTAQKSWLWLSIRGERESRTVTIHFKLCILFTYSYKTWLNVMKSFLNTCQNLISLKMCSKITRDPPK